MPSVCDRCQRPGACCQSLVLHNPLFNGADAAAAQAAVSTVVTGTHRASATPVILSFNPADAGPLAAAFDHVRAGLPFLFLERDELRARNRWRCPLLDAASGRCTQYATRPALCRHFEPGQSDLCVHSADGIGLCAERARGPRGPGGPGAYAASVAAIMARLRIMEPE